jgi:hypothetical protein
LVETGVWLSTNAGQILCQILPVNFARDISQGKETFGHGGEGHCLPVGVEVEAGAGAGRTGYQQCLGARIPQGKGENADQMLDARLSPAFVSVQDQGAVGDPCCWPIRTELGEQFRAVVEPAIHNQPALAIRAHHRLPFIAILRRNHCLPLSQAHRAVLPLAAALRAVDMQSRPHTCQIVRVHGSIVEMEQSEDRTHRFERSPPRESTSGHR